MLNDVPIEHCQREEVVNVLLGGCEFYDWQVDTELAVNKSSTFREFPVCKSFLRISPERERHVSTDILNYSVQGN